jgi:hypothetical protein
MYLNADLVHRKILEEDIQRKIAEEMENQDQDSQAQKRLALSKRKKPSKAELRGDFLSILYFVFT